MQRTATAPCAFLGAAGGEGSPAAVGAAGCTVRLEGLELRLLELGFRRPVRTAAGTHRARPVVVVRVRAEGVDGWGEGGAMADGAGVDPPVGELWEELCTTGVARLFQAARARGGALPGASQVPRLFGGRPVQRMAAAALEMAVLDAELRSEGRPALSRVGGPPADGERARVPAGAAVGIPVDRRAATLLQTVDDLVGQGFCRLRIKIEPGWDVVPVEAVRRCHPGLVVQADANGSYRLGAVGPESAARLAALDAFGLACVEQPLPATDLPGHAELAGLLATPVCLDESLGSPRQVEDAIRYGACEVACLKPSRLGGLSAARRAHDTCRSAGVAAFVGGLFESGLGRAANAALATLPGFTLPGDLSPPSGYLVEDPFWYPTLEGGAVALGDGPGIGALPDPEVLERVTARRRWFPAPW